MRYIWREGYPPRERATTERGPSAPTRTRAETWTPPANSTPSGRIRVTPAGNLNSAPADSARWARYLSKLRREMENPSTGRE